MEAGACKIAGSLRCGVMVFGQSTKLFCKSGQHVKSCGTYAVCKNSENVFLRVLWCGAMAFGHNFGTDSRQPEIRQKNIWLAVLWAIDIQTD